MKLSNFEEDLEKQEKGSPYYMGIDAAFYVKRFGTNSSNKEIELIKKNLYGFSPKDMDMGLILGTWLAEYGVTNWENILGDDDVKLDFSTATSRKVFLNPSYFNSLNSQLIQHATDYSNYLKDEIQEDIEQAKKN